MTSNTHVRRAALGLLVLLLAVAAGGAPAGATEGVVNVNTATLEELQLLPGIGAAKAQAILDARSERGEFESVDELLEVRGIGPAGLENLRPYVVVTGETTASR